MGCVGFKLIANLDAFLSTPILPKIYSVQDLYSWRYGTDEYHLILHEPNKNLRTLNPKPLSDSLLFQPVAVDDSNKRNPKIENVMNFYTKADEMANGNAYRRFREKFIRLSKPKFEEYTLGAKVIFAQLLLRGYFPIHCMKELPSLEELQQYQKPMAVI